MLLSGIWLFDTFAIIKWYVCVCMWVKKEAKKGESLCNLIGWCKFGRSN